MCRAKWETPAGPSYSSVGYLNLGITAGISQKRDTSSCGSLVPFLASSAADRYFSPLASPPSSPSLPVFPSLLLVLLVADYRGPQRGKRWDGGYGRYGEDDWY